MKRMILFKEKNGINPFIFETDEDLYKIALFVLRERWDEFIYDEYPELDREIEGEKKFIEDLKKDMQGSVSDDTKHLLKERIAFSEGRLKTLKKELLGRNETKKALVEKNGRLAYIVLLSRRYAEYENFEVMDVKEVKDLA